MRTPRLRSIRARIFALVLVPLLALVPLWGFSVLVTAPSGMNLLAFQQLQPEVGVPTEGLGSALAAERRAALVHLANPAEGGDDFTERREATEEALENFRTVAAGDAQDVAPPKTRALTRKILTDIEDLGATRASVDDTSGDQQEVFDHYTGLITTSHQILSSLTFLEDLGTTEELQSLARTTASRDLLAQEDALLAAGIAEGRLDTEAHSRFVQQVGAVKASYEGAVTNLPEQSLEEYREITESPSAERLRRMEDAVIEAGPGEIPPEVTPNAWESATGNVMNQVRELELMTAEDLQYASLPTATGILARAGGAALLGFAGVVLSIVFTVRTGRRLINEITGLKTQVQKVAGEQLPNVVRILRQGDTPAPADLEPSAPAFEPRTRELDDLNRAFEEARRVAIQSATGEARLRENINDVIVNLARRNQTLLHRQLKLFDQLERRVADPDELRDLFVLDHLATRMRRYAESLLILAGTKPGRVWSRPMPVQDVVRAASTEVEDYHRVTVLPMPPTRIAGGAVTDVMRLLAELIENATQASPPTNDVSVRGFDVANGFVIEVEDSGLGLGARALADANALLADPPELDLAKRTELGLFVVGTLAKRHGVKVHLRESPYGGITAIVLLGHAILTEGPETREGGEESDDAAAPPAVEMHTPAASIPERPAAGNSTAHRNGAAPLPPRPEGTPGGRSRSTGRRLPQRVRQANLVPQLQDDPEERTTGSEGPRERSPEQTRSMLSALQSGWTRGRNEEPEPYHRTGETPSRQEHDHSGGDQ